MVDNLLPSVFGLDNIIGVIFLVFMVTTWFLRREASKREHDARLLFAKLKHERDLKRDDQFFTMHNEMLSLLRDCQSSVSTHLESVNQVTLE